MKLVYFAWVRERVGKPDEEIDVPTDIETVADLIDWLKSRDQRYEHAFQDIGVIRVAIDRVHVPPATSLTGAQEVAFFPPMTGG